MKDKDPVEEALKNAHKKFRYAISYFGGAEDGTVLAGMVELELGTVLVLHNTGSFNDLILLMREEQPKLKDVQFGVMGIVRLDVEL